MTKGKQTTLSMAGFNRFAKPTRREVFLAEMDKIVHLHLPDWLGHTVSYQSTWYASNTKFLTGSTCTLANLYLVRGKQLRLQQA